MKFNYYLSLLFSLLIVIALCCLPLFAQEFEKTSGKVETGTLKVIIEGLENDRGEVQIGLFQDAESWDDKKEKCSGAYLKINNNKADWILENVLYGEYAVRFFHDENLNSEMDTNFLGIPTEDYGFSNNAKALFGMPSFEEAKFKMDSKNKTIKIIL
jgi:uncharacterized protein (DUF2141 family)